MRFQDARIIVWYLFLLVGLTSSLQAFEQKSKPIDRPVGWPFVWPIDWLACGQFYLT